MDTNKDMLVTVLGGNVKPCTYDNLNDNKLYLSSNYKSLSADVNDGYVCFSNGINISIISFIEAITKDTYMIDGLYFKHQNDFIKITMYDTEFWVSNISVKNFISKEISDDNNHCLFKSKTLCYLKTKNINCIKIHSN